jgi:hypothetical protein
VGPAGIGEAGVGRDPKRHFAEPEMGSIHVPSFGLDVPGSRFQVLGSRLLNR